MGLLHYRIEPCAGQQKDDLFQVLARLSLANDNDQLIERMIGLFPYAAGDAEDLFRQLTKADQYETHLWDIEPRCEVVGVGWEPNTVLVNDCRAIPIRWKSFPRMKYTRHKGIKKQIAQLFVRSGAWWMVMAYTLAFTYAPLFLSNLDTPSNDLYRWLWGIILLFISVGALLSLTGPFAVRRLFGGSVLQSEPHLIGFEGIMPVRKLERLVFGNHQGRLSYEPSSTPYCRDNRRQDIREGKEPEWVKNVQWMQDPNNPNLDRPEIFPGHRLFTLVDTGALTVSIFQSRRPPTVALITGSEGGMLRAVLCSWRFSTDCLYKETVMRMPSDTWHSAKATGWLKLCLLSQGDLVEEMRI